ncbi:MAG TPA: DNA-binding protein WhiA, partial [Candidatus Limnocylindrales bacterium]|nr:DNA-binding protein WhiA [Candidatus Limnocylindrales bacterium]
IRAELAAIEPTRRCCRAAERAGLAEAAEGRARSPMVARLAVRLGRSPSGAAFDWDAAAEHCRAAWLRGRFLARGSLSLAPGRTHLEFVVPADEAAILAARLASVGLPASRRLRRGAGVVTWKGVERIGGFLRLAGAGAALLELEARLVGRSLRQELNRALNAETANLGRTVRAARRQRAAIEALESSGVLGGQPGAVRELARLRAGEPEASLAELADRLGRSRAWVQRTLERLESLALHADGSSATRG